MFRISHVLGVHCEHDRRCVAEIQSLLEAAFPYLAEESDYVVRKLNSPPTRGYPVILLAAHGSDDRVIGFALADYFESIGYAYLDFIVTQAERQGRGLGGALYEALREDLIARGAKGLFLEVPTDDPTQVTNSALLKANKARLKFYERYGALPIVGTLYDQPIRPGNPPEPRLLFDPLGKAKSLEAATFAPCHHDDPDAEVPLRARGPVCPPGGRLGQGRVGPDPEVPLHFAAREAQTRTPAGSFR